MSLLELRVKGPPNIFYFRISESIYHLQRSTGGSVKLIAEWPN